MSPLPPPPFPPRAAAEVAGARGAGLRGAAGAASRGLQLPLAAETRAPPSLDRPAGTPAAGSYSGAAQRPRTGVGVSEQRAAASAAAAASAPEPRAALRSMRPAAGPARASPGRLRPRGPGLQLPSLGASCLCCVFLTTSPLFASRSSQLSGPPVQTKPGLDLFHLPTASENLVLRSLWPRCWRKRFLRS